VISGKIDRDTGFWRHHENKRRDRKQLAAALYRYRGSKISANIFCWSNFEAYLSMFSQWFNVPIRGEGHPMPNVTAGASH